MSLSKEEKFKRKLERMRKTVEKVPDSFGADQLLQYAVAKMLKYGLENNIEAMKERLERVAMESIIDINDWLQGNGKIEGKKETKKTTKKAEKVTVSESDLL